MGNSLICLHAEEEHPQRRVLIDKNMIGLPTDFKHVAHGGSDEAPGGSHQIAGVMSSKGGYMQGISVAEDFHRNAVPIQNPMVQLC